MNASLNLRLWLNSLALCVVVFLSGCAIPDSISKDEDGIGGTGIIASGGEDGIGGTGLRDPDPADGDGIGGTGAWENGAVALFGVVTNTDPLVVNGHGMLLDDSTAITINGQQTSKLALQVGSTAWVKADLVGGAIFAQQIHLQNAVRGPVESFDSETQDLVVLGQSVKLGLGTKGYAQDLSEGQWVDVSGIRNIDGTIEASLITAANETEGAFVRGYREISDDGFSQIGQLRFSAGAANSSLPGVVTVVGDYENNRFEPTQIVNASGLPFGDTVATYLVQAYVELAGPNVAISRDFDIPNDLIVTPRTSTELSRLNRTKSLIIEFSATPEQRLQLQNIRALPVHHPSQTIIPGYRPPAAHGTLAPGRGIEPVPHVGAREPSAVNPGIDGRSAIPTTPAASPGRPTATMPPTVPTDSIEIRPAPQIRAPLPASQMPSTDALPSVGGPR